MVMSQDVVRTTHLRGRARRMSVDRNFEQVSSRARFDSCVTTSGVGPQVVWWSEGTRALVERNVMTSHSQPEVSKG